MMIVMDLTAHLLIFSPHPMIFWYHLFISLYISHKYLSFEDRVSVIKWIKD